MKIIPTVPSDLHLRISETVKLKNSSKEELKRKQYRKNREEFMERVHIFLGKNFIKQVDLDRKTQSSPKKFDLGLDTLI